MRGNTVTATTGVGIAVFTASAGSTISTTTVEQNEVYANTGHAGIAAWSESVNTAQVNSLTTLTIRDNHIHDHTAGSGIAVNERLLWRSLQPDRGRDQRQHPVQER